MLVPEDLAPWENQPHEKALPFHAFAHYRDLPPHVRSVDRAWREHRQRCVQIVALPTQGAEKNWRKWASDWGWVERALAWDREMDRVARDKILQDQAEARVRHARLAQATLAALSIPSRAALEALQDPLVMQKLVTQAKTSTKALVKLVDLVSWAAKSIPGLVDVERLALGLTTEAISVELTHREDPALQIPNDPIATDLALQLLDRYAQRTPAVLDRAPVTVDAVLIPPA